MSYCKSGKSDVTVSSKPKGVLGFLKPLIYGEWALKGENRLNHFRAGQNLISSY